MSDIAEKAALRPLCRRRRDGLDATARARAATEVADAAEALAAAGGAGIVALYRPIGSELDTAALIARLRARGVGVALPEIVGRDKPLAFRLWRAGAALLPHGFGTLWPGPDAPAVRPDWIFAPLLAFDRFRGRLGYGGGYYDRTLAAAPGTPAWGLAYAAQEVDRVPMAPYDRRLDGIVTEAGVIGR